MYVLLYPLRGRHGNPLQCSCLENPMDRGPWWATVHGVTRSQTWLMPLNTNIIKRQVWTTVFRDTYVGGMEHPTPVLLPGESQRWGSLVGRTKSDTTEWLHFHFSLFTFMHWRKQWQPTPVFLPGESQRRGSLVGRTKSDTTEAA